MKGFLKVVFGTITGIVLLLFMITMFFVIAGMSGDKEVEVKKNTIVEIPLSGSIRPDAEDIFSQFFEGDERPVSLNMVRSFVNEYKDSDKIDGVFINFSGLSSGFADLEELRSLLSELKDSGKTIYAYSEYYSQASYYVASVADSVYVSPGGGLEWKGLAAQLMFFKEALDKVGVEMQILRVGEFKSAVEPFIKNEMSDANRLQTQKMIDDLWGVMVSNVSSSRGISEVRLNELADSLTITSSQRAFQSKMVDRLVYADVIRDEVEDDKNWMKINDIPIKKESKHDKGVIAVLRASGEIVDGAGQEDQIGGSSLVKVINDLREDDDIDAVVLEINSPGGSALASDNIWNALKRLKAEKPLIAYMTNYAASGGYYIAACADSIIAHPTTVTGSIGVFGMMPNAQELLNEKLGVHVNVVKSNNHAQMGTPFHPLTDYEQKQMQEHVEQIYDRFLSIVAEGRGMSVEEVHSIGQGRVWTGLSAVENGLVDALGGFENAIQAAKNKANLENFVIRSYPKKSKWQRQLETFIGGQVKTALVGDTKVEEMVDYMQALKNYKGVMARPEFFMTIQ